MRLEKLGNNMSRDQIEEYRAQLDAQREQIEMDRAMAAGMKINTIMKLH